MGRLSLGIRDIPGELGMFSYLYKRYQAGWPRKKGNSRFRACYLPWICSSHEVANARAASKASFPARKHNFQVPGLPS